MTIINNNKELYILCKTIMQDDIIGIDTEFTRTKTYYPELSLIQIGFYDHHFIIDALAPEIDIKFFIETINSPKILKIIHAPSQDITAIYKSTNIFLHNIFDTQLAALFAGIGYSLSYSNLCNSLLDKKICKKFQFSNWQQRPLSIKQEEYALTDVKYLHQLYDKIIEKLKSLGRYDWMLEEIKNKDQNIPQDICKKNSININNINSYIIAKKILEFREKYCENNNIAPNIFIKLELINEFVKSDCDLNVITNANLKEDVKDLLLTQISIIKDSNITNEDRNEFELNFSKIKNQRLFTLCKEILKYQANKLNLPEWLIAKNDDIQQYIDFSQNKNFLKGWRYEVFGQFVEKLR